MSRGINKHTLVGHIGKDVTRRSTQNGTTVTNFSVATGESWKDRDTGEWQERTEWHDVVAFGKLGDICADKLTSGDLVYVEGKSRTEKWEDEKGVMRYSTKLYADEMTLLNKKTPPAAEE